MVELAGVILSYLSILAFPVLLLVVTIRDILLFFFKGRGGFGRGWRILEMLVLVMPVAHVWSMCIPRRGYEGRLIPPPANPVLLAATGGLSMLAYLYCSFRRKWTSPAAEIILNSLLMVGIGLSVFLGQQLKGFDPGSNFMIIYLPLDVQFLSVLGDNYRKSALP